MSEDAILQELREQTKWLRFLVIVQLKKILEQTLTDRAQRKIYDASDGNKTCRDIANKLLDEGIKITHMTVTNYWRKWAALGIVIPSKKRSGRFQKIMSLEDLNITA